ncbi:MAG TPA: DNA topoisomerase IB [Amaricoccus sp.]|nr:DNA topoisomerase IB [Amaricoccus sp.]
MKIEEAIASEPEVPPGLVYVSDGGPGFLRRRQGKGFSYRTTAGELASPAERARIEALAIPPAWEDVWICADPNGHLQATGVDAAGRRQYRYHADWSAWRAQRKYDGLAGFGLALPRFRRRVLRDLGRDPGERELSLAAIATLLDRLHLRVGSAAHTARNRTFGATTLLHRHLRLGDGEIVLRFRAKGGRMTEHRLQDTRLHRIFEAIDDLPGRNLFTWVDADGLVHPIGSEAVNAYLAAATGLAGVSAKTFRTWAGTLAAFTAARQTTGRLGIRVLAEAAAARLHNTPAISRSAYIHPTVLGLVEMPPEARTAYLAAVPAAGPRQLRADERRLLGLLSTPPTAEASAERASTARVRARRELPTEPSPIS